MSEGYEVTSELPGRPLENRPIVLLYGTYLPVVLVVFVVHTISYICDRVSLVHEFYRGKTQHKRKDFVLLGCGTYFIEDNTIQ